MKVALITDTHFGARSENLNFNEYFFDFYENVFFPYLKENNITTVIHLGDVMDRRKYVSYRIAKDFRERFVNQFDGIDFHMLNSENMSDTMKLLKTSPAQVCMGHLELNGFAMQKGFIMDHGWDKKEFNRFDMVMSGHYHHKSDDGHVYYLGTPYEIYWNDHDDPKGFHIFDTNTRQLERIVNPLTMFSKIYYDDSVEMNNDMTRYKNKYVKLIVVNKKDLYQFDKFVDKLLQADCYEVKIIEDFSELDASNVSDDIVKNTEDTMTLLDRYIDELDVTLSKDRLKNTMRTLYTEAQDLEL